MRILKRVFQGLLWLVAVVGLLLAGVLAAVYLQDPLYARRILTFRPGQLVTAVDWYQPQEIVRGTRRDDLRVAPEAERTIPAAALEAARRYADATASIALLVWHDGAIQSEHYWPGYGPDTRTDPASMHKTVLGLLAGAAIADGLIPSVDAPASRWLEEWRNDARAGIRVRDLLQMQSGLELVPFSPNPFGSYFKSLLGTDIDAVALGRRAAQVLLPADHGAGLAARGPAAAGTGTRGERSGSARRLDPCHDDTGGAQPQFRLPGLARVAARGCASLQQQERRGGKAFGAIPRRRCPLQRRLRRAARLRRAVAAARDSSYR